jgi:hypothetical protein
MNLILLILCSWPLIVLTHWYVSVDQIFIISLLHDARNVAALLKSIQFTLLVCPFKVFSISPDSLSHNLIEESSDADASKSWIG